LTIVTSKTIQKVPPAGISKLSGLEIDVSKDWAEKLIKNLGAPVDPTDVARHGDKVSRAGDTMTGDLKMGEGSCIRLYDANGEFCGYVYADTVAVTFAVVPGRRFELEPGADGDVVPFMGDTYGLGSTIRKWKHLYLSRNLYTDGLVDGVDVGSHDHGSGAGMGSPTVRMRSGLAADRPVSGDAAGDFYYATDTHALSIWDGDSWESVTLT
jgi:hypothetical protein